MRFTRGKVRLASARVKNLWATSLRHHYSLNVFRMRYEPNHLLVAIQYHDGRTHVVIGRIYLLRDLEAFQLSIGLYDGSVGAYVTGGRAVGRIVAGADAARDDVTVGYGPEIVPVFGVIDDGYDRDILHPHQRGNLGRGRPRSGDHRIGNHYFRCAHGPILKPFSSPGNPSRRSPGFDPLRTSLRARRRPARRRAAARLSASP